MDPAQQSNRWQAEPSKYLVASCRPVIVLRGPSELWFGAESVSTTHQIIQQLCFGVELVDESRKAESSLSAQVDQRVEL